MTMTKTPVVADLEQRRQVLAFEVEQGDRDGAVEEPEAVETQLAKIRRQQERQVLADRVPAVRASAKTEAAGVAQRHEPDAHLAQKRREPLVAARGQEPVGPFRQAVEEDLTVGRSFVAAVAALGPTSNEKPRGQNQLNLALHACPSDLVDVITPPIETKD